MQTLFGKQTMRTVVVADLPTLVHWMPFFREGWADLCSPCKGRGDLTQSEWLTILMLAVDKSPHDALVTVFTSTNDKPLGFTVAINDSETPERRTVSLYAGYSNGKYAHFSEESVAFNMKWAKQAGFTAMHTQSQRLSGAAMRFFRKKLGFKPVAVIFKKEIV